jgi:hypothetical protein
LRFTVCADADIVLLQLTAPATTLLPIAVRELRVSARAKATHRLRMSFAISSVAVAAAIELIVLSNRGMGSSQLGVIIFQVIRWIAFVFACGSGVFLTADCLSEEKREGTLGLLFLTDLRGYDVVLGKLFATSLRSFYSLLAIFPVLALSFILGGVATADFNHTLAALCNTLFFSLALGMLVSAASRDTHKAMTATLALMCAFLFLTLDSDQWSSASTGVIADLRFISPAFAFTHTDSYHSSDYWKSVALQHLAAWIFLALASWLAPKSWHDKVVGRKFSFFRRRRNSSRDRTFLDREPIGWIVARDRWVSNLSRVFVGLSLIAFALSLASLFQRSPPGFAAGTSSTVISSNTTSNSSEGTTFVAVSFASGVAGNIFFRIASVCSSAFSWVLQFWLAAHVVRFYVDGKRNGFFELLLATPLRPADIIRGHWRGLRRLFGLPVVAQLALSLSIGVIETLAVGAAAMAAGSSGPFAGKKYQIEQAIVMGVNRVAWVALTWLSIWHGLVSKKIAPAILKVFWYGKILPWFCIYFAMGIMTIAVSRVISSPTAMLLAFEVVPQLVFMGVACALVVAARRAAPVAFSKILIAAS